MDAASVLILSRIASSMNLVNGMPSRAEACLACRWISSSSRSVVCLVALNSSDSLGRWPRFQPIGAGEVARSYHFLR